MHKHQLFALAIAGLLFFACAIPAWAAVEPLPAASLESGISLGQGTPPEPTTIQPPEPTPTEPESAASEVELLSWLEAHKATGGALTLTADITITRFAEFPITAPVTIDCGGYSLFVAHNFSLMGNILVKGVGTDQGLVRILPGGMLTLDYGATVQSERGIGVWQEEGAAFYNGVNLAADTVHYADTPIIIWFDSGNDDLIAVAKDGSYAELLPKEKKATVNQNGENALNIPMPLVWDTAAAQQSLADKRRTTLTGSFAPHAMLATVEPPSCTVVFRERAVTFQRFAIRGTDAYAPISLTYFLPPQPLDLTFSYSFDGETWTPLLQQTHNGAEEIGVFQPVLIREYGYIEALAEDEILWPADSQANSLRFIISYEEKGKTLYSDVICFDGDTFTPGEDYDGNRGGGGELDGGDTLPPSLGLPPGNGGTVPEDVDSATVGNGSNDHITPPAESTPWTETPTQPIKPAPPQTEEAFAMSPQGETPLDGVAQPDHAPLSKPLQIVLGGLLTLGILGAFVFYGKKR